MMVEGCFSDWWPVTSGVPQDSVLAYCCLSSISIIWMRTHVMISKFANYTKVDGIVDSVVKNSTGIFDRLIDAK